MLPGKVIVDSENKFQAESKTMVHTDYSYYIKNTQANCILERSHQIIDNMIHTFKLQDMVLDDEYSWDGLDLNKFTQL